MTRAPAPAPTPAVIANVFPLPANFKKVVAAPLTLLTAPPSTFISFILLPIPIGSFSKASAICLAQPDPPCANVDLPSIEQILFTFLSANFSNLLDKFDSFFICSTRFSFTIALSILLGLISLKGLFIIPAPSVFE